MAALNPTISGSHRATCEWLVSYFRPPSTNAGVEPIGVHGLRHRWATLALESGVHAKIVPEHLGHANIATTLDIYSHVVPEMDQEAATTVANLIDYRHG